jgi:post-segregation antitoxin (ccd killing protein)
VSQVERIETPGWWTAAPTGSVTAMATANVTVSLDPSVIAMAKDQARAAGLSMSAWVAKTIRAAAIAEAARRYEQFERESGNAEATQAWDEARGAEQSQRLAGGEW